MMNAMRTRFWVDEVIFAGVHLAGSKFECQLEIKFVSQNWEKNERQAVTNIVGRKLWYQLFYPPYLVNGYFIRIVVDAEDSFSLA